MNNSTPTGSIDEPTLKKSPDGIYPRCVYCNGEIYGPSVIYYSEGKMGCSAVNGCGKKLPADYIVLAELKGDHHG